MTTAQLLKNKQAYLKEIDKVKAACDKKYSKDVSTYIKQNSPFQNGQVVEKSGYGSNKLKYSRMVIYEILIKWFDKNPMVLAYGWYLDKSNTPVKWEGGGLPILNCSGQYDIILSENQENNPVPDALK